MFNNLHQAAQVWQDCTAHQDGNLLHNLDACVPGLPGFLAFTHSFEEGQKRGNTESWSHHSKSSGCGVSDVLVHVVNVRSHCGDHCSQTSSLEHRSIFYTVNKRLERYLIQKQINLWKCSVSVSSCNLHQLCLLIDTERNSIIIPNCFSFSKNVTSGCRVRTEMTYMSGQLTLVLVSI